MAGYSYRRRKVNRSNRRSYTRKVPRHGYRKSYRSRRGPIRRRAMRGVQDTVRYTAKCFNSFGLNWYIKETDVTASDNYLRYSRTLTLNAFVSGNKQFIQNIKDYSYVKFNYFAVKIHDLLYMGFDRQYNGGTGGNPMPYSMGVTALAADRYPMYFAWDADERFTFDPKSTVSTVISPSQLVQYEGSKRLSPSSKTPVSFVYRVPQPWKQFFRTTALPDFNNYIDVFLATMSGVKNLRCPQVLLGTHPNWYGAALPDDGKTANIVSEVGMTCYLGVTFKGRKTMGTSTGSASDSYHQIVTSTVPNPFGF